MISRLRTFVLMVLRDDLDCGGHKEPLSSDMEAESRSSSNFM